MTTQDVLSATIRSIQKLDCGTIDAMAETILRVKNVGGKLLIIGNGGGHGHASHAVCDFRKLCQVEAYCPSDNASELTARVNDDGWDTAYLEWLRGCRVGQHDAVLVISVGGGSEKPPVSTNIVKAINFAKGRSAAILAIVGRDGGHAAKKADVSVLIPCDAPELVTPVTESVQSLVLHALAVHPLLAINKAKWEGMAI